MKTHELKCWPAYFEAIYAGVKTFEIRKDDRDYSVGDYLNLKEYDPCAGEYSGRGVDRFVTYISEWEQKPGFVVMAISEKQPREQDSPASDFASLVAGMAGVPSWPENEKGSLL